MSNISQPGTYRGVVVDRGLSESSGGCTQLEVTLQATEVYDEKGQVWTPFSYEDSEAQAYINLITKAEKGNAINLRQVVRAFGWDGMSWATLNDSNNDLAKQIQWRMGIETYEGVDRCKVQAIDAYDAAPGRKVERLDAAKVRALDAKYAAILKSIGGGPKPKTAAPAAPKPAQGTSAPNEAAAEPAKPKRGRPPAPKAPPAGKPMDQGAAWESVYGTGNKAGKSDMEITNAWTAVVHEIGGDEAVGADWSGVVVKVKAALGV